MRRRLRWPSRAIVRDALHVVALSAIAVAQPLFDLLGSNATFFVAHRAERAEVLLFAFFVLLVPPAALLALEGLVALVSRRARRVVHLLILGALVALALTPAMLDAFDPGGRVGLTLFVIATIAAAFVLHRFETVRQILSVASVAPLVFLGLFLFGSQVQDIVFPSTSGASATSIGSDASVAFLVFDEFSLGTIMRPDGTIDADRFPNFARLAETSNWYPRATTVAPATHQAIPALVSGTIGEWNDIPTAATHPRNVFSLLDDSRSLAVDEIVTRLCDSDRCGDTDEDAEIGSLFEDSAIVYLHTVLPDSLRERWLPEVNDRWADFGDDTDVDDAPPSAGDTDASGAAVSRSDFNSRLRADLAGSQTARLDAMLPRLGANRGPQLWYLHLSLPHVPWRYLPSGQVYDGARIPGFNGVSGQWGPSAYLVDAAQQRYLLQAQFSDRILGRFLDRLEASGRFDDTMVVVAADHGVGFSANGWRRAVLDGNESDILPVPLFLKLPGQQKGAIDERKAELIDVLPTIVDALDIKVDWEFDGVSLLSKGPIRERYDVVMPDGLEHVATVDPTKRARQIVHLFGAGKGPFDLYGMGRHRNLAGRQVTALDVGSPRSDLFVRLDDPDSYLHVLRSAEFLPARLTATVEGGDVGDAVVVALNGVVAGMGEIYSTDARARVGIMLSPHLFTDGSNELALFVVDAGVLRPIPMQPVVRYAIERDASGSIVSVQSTKPQHFTVVTRDAIRADVNERSQDRNVIMLRGWVVDLSRQRVPDTVLFVADGEVLASTSRLHGRRDVREAFGVTKKVARCGFATEFAAPDIDVDTIDVIALFGNEAYVLPR